MNQSLIVVSVDEAINKLNRYKQMYGDHIMVCIIDLTNGVQSKERKTIEEGYSILTKSAKLIFNEDEYVPHLMAFNLKSKDILPKCGKVHDFLL